MLHDKAIRALELSALRQVELRPMLDGIDDLDLTQFEYIAFHAPSRFNAQDEEEIVEMLAGIRGRGWPVVLHPDTVHNFALWRRLGRMLCAENMDRQARQIDTTMTEAYFILKRFGRCLRQVHLSEVKTRSKHDPLSYASILAFQEVAPLIPLEERMGSK